MLIVKRALQWLKVWMSAMIVDREQAGIRKKDINCVLRFDEVDKVNLNRNHYDIAFLIGGGKEVHWVYRSREERDEVYSILKKQLRLTEVR